MPTDAAFVIGTRHSVVAAPCQDYARAGDGWVAVADGCSTGGHTDIGARVWVQSAKKVIEAEGVALVSDGRKFMARVLNEGKEQMRVYPVEDGLATLGIGALVESKFHAVLQGDGCVAVALCDGGIEYCEIAAPMNAPLYPQYLLNGDHVNQWKTMVNGAYTQVRTFRYDAEGVLVSLKDTELDGDDLFFSRSWNTAEAYAMLVCSDGVFSVPNKTAFDVLSELFSVKDRSGAFMQRRLAAIQRGWARRREDACTDDLAVGGVWLPTA